MKMEERERLVKEEAIERGLREGRIRGREEGREEGRQEGLEEGAEKERLSNARKMNNKGLDYATITDITGLTSEEIANL